MKKRKKKKITINYIDYRPKLTLKLKLLLRTTSKTTLVLWSQSSLFILESLNKIRKEVLIYYKYYSYKLGVLLILDFFNKRNCFLLDKSPQLKSHDRWNSFLVKLSKKS